MNTDQRADQSPTLVGPDVPEWARRRTGETLTELFERAVERHAGSVAITIARGRRVERWTYRQLVDAALDATRSLWAAGVRPGDRVVTWSPNDPWLVAAYFGAWRLGAAIVPLDVRMAPDVAVRIAARTNPTLVLADVGLADLAGGLGAPVVVLGRHAFEAGAGGELPPLPAADTLAEVLFTSGTTSDPKGVVLTHAALVHSARAIAVTAGLERERALSFIPLSHMYGQLVPLFLGLLSGSQVTFLASLTPQALFETLKRERITAITAVPHVMQLLLDAIEREAARTGRSASLRRARSIARRLPLRLRRLVFRSVVKRLGGSLRVITSGGARLPAELQAGFEDMGVRVIQGYGATECAAICGHSRSRRRMGTVGPPLASMTVTLAADGELLARGPNATSGYWERDTETAQVLAGGWVHTGDAAAFDRGEVVILGRTRDRIALPNGLKVYPDDVETALRAQPTIRDAVVLEHQPGQIVAVLVADGAASDEALDGALRDADQSLAPHQRVRRWWRWPEADLPRTHTLKVRRAEVARWVASIASGAVAAAPGADKPIAADDDIVGAIARTLTRTRGAAPPDLGSATALADLDLDSLALVALALELEDSAGVALEVDELSAAATVGALVELVHERRGAPSDEPEPSLWALSAPARVVREVLGVLLVRPALRLIAHPALEGRDHLAQLPGPVLICGNHSSHLDAPLIEFALPARMRRRTAVAAAADYFFDRTPLLGTLTALAFGAFPFGRVGRVRASLERICARLDAGWNVILFPEGTRSVSGEQAPFLDGIGLLATEFGARVVPVHIDGAHALLPKGSARPRRGRVTIRFGPPVEIPAGASISAATQAVEAAVRALQPDRLRQ